MSVLAPFRRNARTSVAFEPESAAAVSALQVSFYQFQLFLGDIRLCLLRLGMTSLFLRGWLFGLLNNNFRLMIIASCASSSCDEREYLFSRCRLQLHACQFKSFIEFLLF